MAKPVWTSEQILDQFLREGDAWNGVSTIPFSFFTSAPASSAGDPERGGFQAFTAEEQSFTRQAFAAVADVTNLHFAETPSTGSSLGRIAFAQSTTIEDYAWGFTITSTQGSNIRGAEIWLNTDAVDDRSWLLGGYNYLALMHEVLHALGLPHPGDYNANGETITYANDAVYFQDSRQYTVMSYFAASETGANYQMADGLYSASTLLLHDIQALQALYGANTSTRSGDTVYGFNATPGIGVYDCTINTHPIWCVWDGGGIDRLDFSGYTVDQRIDLREGAFSDTAGMTMNISIAYGAAIEQAAGGGGNDNLTGNALANLLMGGAGNDVLDGLGGADTLMGGGGDDFLWLGAGDVLIDGGAGGDTVGVHGALAQFSGQGMGGVGGALLIADGAGVQLSGIEAIRFDDGTVSLVAASGLLDPLYYVKTYGDVFRAGVTPSEHYAVYGWKEGRDPDSLFSTVGYLASNADVKAGGYNPLTHYSTSGWKEGRDPSAGFDTQLYLLRNPDVAAAGLNPLEHYLNYGRYEGRAIYAAVGAHIQSNGFDAEYYLLANRDVAISGMDPWLHFETYGWKEGRDPNAWFDTDGYLAHNLDVAAAGMNPLLHYDIYGWKENRDPSANFDTFSYLAHNADVAAAGIDPLTHFLAYGLLEGRAAYHADDWLS